MPTHTSTLKIQIFKNPLKMQGEEKVKKVTNLMAGFNKKKKTRHTALPSIFQEIKNHGNRNYLINYIILIFDVILGAMIFLWAVCVVPLGSEFHINKMRRLNHSKLQQERVRGGYSTPETSLSSSDSHTYFISPVIS